MSNHAAGYMLNEFLGEFIEKGYLERFTDEEKEDIIRILGRNLRWHDGNFPEMITGYEKIFGICHACEEKVGAEDLKNGMCSKCRG